MGKLIRFAGYAALGPVTGLCAARAVHHWNSARPLALLYILAGALAWVVLPFILRVLLDYDLSHLQQLRGTR